MKISKKRRENILALVEKIVQCDLEIPADRRVNLYDR